MLAAFLVFLPRSPGVPRPWLGQQAWDREAQTVDLGACLDTLEGNHGTTKGAKAVEVACEGNRALALVFKELAEFSFKVRNKELPGQEATPRRSFRGNASGQKKSKKTHTRSPWFVCTV